MPTLRPAGLAAGVAPFSEQYLGIVSAPQEFGVAEIQVICDRVQLSTGGFGWDGGRFMLPTGGVWLVSLRLNIENAGAPFSVGDACEFICVQGLLPDTRVEPNARLGISSAAVPMLSASAWTEAQWTALVDLGNGGRQLNFLINVRTRAVTETRFFLGPRTALRVQKIRE